MDAIMDKVSKMEKDLDEMITLNNAKADSA